MPKAFRFPKAGKVDGRILYILETNDGETPEDIVKQLTTIQDKVAELETIVEHTGSDDITCSDEPNVFYNTLFFGSRVPIDTSVSGKSFWLHPGSTMDTILEHMPTSVEGSIAPILSNPYDNAIVKRISWTITSTSDINPDNIESIEVFSHCSITPDTIAPPYYIKIDSILTTCGCYDTNMISECGQGFSIKINFETSTALDNFNGYIGVSILVKISEFNCPVKRGLYAGGELLVNDYPLTESYNKNIEAIMNDLKRRNINLFTVPITPGYDGRYSTGKLSGGVFWDYFRDILRYCNESDDLFIHNIDIYAGLSSRHLLNRTTNRWAITGSTSDENATVAWTNAMDEFACLKNDITIGGPFNNFKGVLIDDFSLDIGNWDPTHPRNHTPAQIAIISNRAALDGLRLGSIVYFARFCRQYAKDGIELVALNSSVIPEGGLTAQFSIPTERFTRFRTYYFEFMHYTIKNPSYTTVDKRCTINSVNIFPDGEVMDTDSVVPEIFPTTDERFNINTYLDFDEPNQVLEFTLYVETSTTLTGGRAQFDIWDIEIKDEFGNIVGLGTPSVPIYGDHIFAGETTSYNLNDKLDPWIVYPKDSEYTYNYRMEKVFSSIVKNSKPNSFYALARARSWGFEPIPSNVILHMQKAKEAGAAATIVYNDPTFISHLSENTGAIPSTEPEMSSCLIAGSMGLGIFYEKTSVERFSKLLYWDQHQGAFEGFYHKLTTVNEFSGDIRLNIRMTGILSERRSTGAGYFEVTITNESGEELYTPISSYIPDAGERTAYEWGDTDGEADEGWIIISLGETMTRIVLTLSIIGDVADLGLGSTNILRVYFNMYEGVPPDGLIDNYTFDSGTTEYSKYIPVWKEVTDYFNST